MLDEWGLATDGCAGANNAAQGFAGGGRLKLTRMAAVGHQCEVLVFRPHLSNEAQEIIGVLTFGEPIGPVS